MKTCSFWIKSGLLADLEAISNITVKPCNLLLNHAKCILDLYGSYISMILYHYCNVCWGNNTEKKNKGGIHILGGKATSRTGAILVH